MEENKQSTQIIKSTFNVIIIMSVIKIFGFLKQTVIASKFGSTTETDVFFIASEFIASICVAVFSSLSVTFLSQYAQSLELNKSIDKSYGFASNIICIFVPVALFLMVLLIIFSGFLSKAVGPLLSNDALELLTYYIKLLSVSIIFYGINAILGAVLEANKVFIPSKMMGLFLSLTTIFSALCLSDTFGIFSLVIALILGYIIQFAYILMSCRKYLKFKPSKPFKDTRVKKVYKLSFPLFIGNSIYQLSLIVDKSIATFLGEGAVSALAYGQILKDFVSSVFAVAISGVLLSHFATYVAKKDFTLLRKVLEKAIIIILIIIIPITIFSSTQSENIIRFIYGHGNFNENAIHNTTLVLIGYSIGFCALTIREVFVKAHYAFNDTKKPMINGAIGISINIVFSIIGAKYLGLLGISLATSISEIIVCALSYFTLKIHIESIDFTYFKNDVLKMCLSGAIVFFINYFIHFTYKSLMLNLLLAFAEQIILYMLLLKIFRCRIFVKYYETIKRKICKRYR